MILWTSQVNQSTLHITTLHNITFYTLATALLSSRKHGFDAYCRGREGRSCRNNFETVETVDDSPLLASES